MFCELSFLQITSQKYQIKLSLVFLSVVFKKEITYTETTASRVSVFIDNNAASIILHVGPRANPRATRPPYSDPDSMRPNC